MFKSKVSREKSRFVLPRPALLKNLKNNIRWYRRWGTLPVRDWLNGAEYFKKGDFASAAVFYRRGLENHSGHPAETSALFDLSYCQYRLQRYQDALENLESLFSRESVIKESYLLYARILVCLGRPVSAAKAMLECLEYYPRDLQVLSCYTHTALSGQMDEDQQEELRSRLYSEKSRLSLEDERNVHLDTAIAHFEMKTADVRKGERMLARVLATGAAPFEAVLLRGERLLEQGRILPAREQLTRAMTASKRDPRPVLMLAKSYLRSGSEFKPDWALQLAEAACRLSQWESAECLSVLARAYEANDQQTNAQIFLERMRNVPSADELNVQYYQSSLRQLRAQKISNT